MSYKNYNNYIVALQALRREIENKIDNEVEECIRGRGDSKRLKESFEYIIDTSHVLNGTYKDEEAN